MDTSNKRLRGENTGKLHNHENLLVISIDKNGKIVQFNKECEKITGYSRNEALNKEFIGFLIPYDNFDDWCNLFEAARRDEIINDFKLPWITQQGRKVTISWSSFPIEGEVGGEMEDICLVGRFIDIISDTDEKSKDAVIEYIKEGIEQEENIPDETDIKTEDKKSFKIGNKRIVFGKPSSASTRNDAGNKISKSPRKEKKMAHASIKSKKPVKDEKIDEDYTPPVKDHHDVDRIIEELERRNQELEKENKKLEKNLKSVKTQLSNIKSNKKLSSSFGRGKREEFENMMQDLDERKSLLDNLEAQLTKEKKDLNKQKDYFCKWREKLEFLEAEVEKRRGDLVEQEKTLKDRTVQHETSSKLGDKTFDPGELNQEDHQVVLDNIPGSAAIIQRGMLKQVNDSFTELLGYEMEDVLGKSLFDFVAPEGLIDIEKYYLCRLKGEDTSSYETVFSTKDDDKIAAAVNIQPTIFNGEKAEIVVIKELSGEREGGVSAGEMNEKTEDPKEKTTPDDAPIKEEPPTDQPKEEKLKK